MKPSHLKTLSLSASALVAVTGADLVSADELTTTAIETPTPETTEVTTATTPVSISAEQVSEAQNQVDRAQAQVEAAQAAQTTAQAAEAQADATIAATNEAIATAENAETIVAEQNQVIADKTAEKATAEAELATTITAQATAQVESDVANQAKATAETAVATAQANLAEKEAVLASKTDTAVQAGIAEQTAAIATADATIASKTNQIATVADQITTKEIELTNYQPTVEKKVVYETKGYEAKSDRDAIAKNMEKTAFQGERTVEIEITQEQYNEWLKTTEEGYNATTGETEIRGYFPFVVDNRAISEAFVSMLNELRELNGFKGNIKIDDEYLAYAEARANEMNTNDRLSHNTTLTGPKNGAVENALGPYLTNREIGTPLSAEQVAYEMLMNWYQDYTNITGKNYGHRRALLTPTGEKLGVALSTADNSHYGAMELAWSTAEMKKEYHEEWGIEIGVPATPEDEAKQAEFYRIYNSWDESDKMAPKVLGRTMVFLPDYKFVYVVKAITEDKGPQLTAELDALKNQKAALVVEKAAAESTKATAQAKLANLQVEADNINQARAAAQVEVDTAKAALTTAQTALTEAAQTADAKAQALTKATALVKSLSNRVAAITAEITTAQAKRDEAQALKDRLVDLKAQLATAQEAKVRAQADQTAAATALTQAKEALTSATANYNHLFSLHTLQKTINLKTNGDWITGVSKVAPTVAEKPVFDLKKLEEATPQIVEKPSLDLGKVDQPSDNRGKTPLVPTPAPTQKEEAVHPSTIQTAYNRTVTQNLSQKIADSRPQQAYQPSLPATGEAANHYALAGLWLLTLTGAGLTWKSKKESN